MGDRKTGAAIWIGLYDSGRSKLTEYSPGLPILVSGGAWDFFSFFRINIFASGRFYNLEVRNQFVLELSAASVSLFRGAGSRPSGH